MSSTFRAALRLDAALQAGQRPTTADARLLAVPRPRTNAELAREAVRRTQRTRSAG